MHPDIKPSNIFVPLCPLFSAALLIFGFPNFNQGYLAWFCLLPLFFYCQEVGPGKKAFFGGLLTGTLFFIYLYSYMALSVNILFPSYLGILVVVTASLYSALFFAGFSLALAYFLRQNRPALTALAVPSLWVLLEFLRSAGLLGHSGGFLGYSQAKYTFLLPLVSFYGYWGLPFCMLLFQVGLFYLCIPPRIQNYPSPQHPSVLPFILLGIMLATGLALPSLFPVQEKEKELRIALIQGNIPQEDIINPDRAPANFQKYIALTDEAAARHGPLDLIVWPETVFSLNVARHYPKAAGELAASANRSEAAILLGGVHEDKVSGDIYNSIMLQRPGHPSVDKERYNKNRLVPVTEYFPFHSLINRIFNSTIVLGAYTPGRETIPFDLGSFTLGGIICFESYFPRPALHIARGRAEHLFVLTNDAWFRKSHGLPQHLYAAIFRAAELGIGVTQVANTGFTRSYDYRGKEVCTLPAYQTTVGLLKSSMPRRLTLYRLLGDYFLILCGAALAWACLRRQPRVPPR